MKNFMLNLFCKLWGFLDQKHIEDFLKWDHKYRVNRKIDKVLSHTNNGKGRVKNG